ncbi:hypothetical protein [Flavobacterium macrobrachii]|uniref:Uncharacterized protein n=1 Tax=Flavobacterium macrobrachii TaxID=591204 RepID=A0ABS2CZZ6_9FLAO|nr:hypothetical protein [Flavobacterium macrobrachii]MBM6499767.1 hypothetical protein [Flavobacterium macrobrachii]
MFLISLFQQTNIEEKIQNAPDNGYLIGVWIGNILPFAVLVGLAWWMYIRAKKRQNND